MMSISSQIPDWFHLVLVRIWSDSFRWNQLDSLELSGIQSEKLEKFPTNLAGFLLPNFRSEFNRFQLVPIGTGGAQSRPPQIDVQLLHSNHYHHQRSAHHSSTRATWGKGEGLSRLSPKSVHFLFLTCFLTNSILPTPKTSTSSFFWGLGHPLLLDHHQPSSPNPETSTSARFWKGPALENSKFK